MTTIGTIAMKIPCLVLFKSVLTGKALSLLYA